MRSMLARARAYETLTPGERALLRLVEGLASVALVGALTAGAQYLGAAPGAAHGAVLGAVDWAGVARVCAAGGLVALLMAVAKYCKAQGDPALGDAIAGLGARVPATPKHENVAPGAALRAAVLNLETSSEIVSADAGAPPPDLAATSADAEAPAASPASGDPAANNGAASAGADFPAALAAILPPGAPR